MFAYALHSVFLAAAISQQYSSRRLTFPHKRRYAQMWCAGAKCDFACASDYSLPPSLREVARQSRDGGSNSLSHFVTAPSKRAPRERSHLLPLQKGTAKTFLVSVIYSFFANFLKRLRRLFRCFYFTEKTGICQAISRRMGRQSILYSARQRSRMTGLKICCSMR